ncbi:MAG: hypothetical protein Q8O13_08115 [Candidatus Omnitrophota bacterium]|nr:hypothetical protein [Candidatus Omnitrophota bacterium]
MKGNPIKVIILLVMVFLAYKFLSSGIKSLTSRPASTAPSEEAPVETIGEEVLPTEANITSSSTTEAKTDILSAMSDYGRVPFVSAQESKSATDLPDAPQSRSTQYEVPQLTTILNYEGKWFAIINGNLVKSGDTIGRIKILQIMENLVIIEEAGKTYKLKLWQEVISK